MQGRVYLGSQFEEWNRQGRGRGRRGKVGEELEAGVRLGFCSSGWTRKQTEANRHLVAGFLIPPL